uniref:Uncharacterized protein n=1 Tax=Setaria italica TaxID=4555 RepID=K3Z1D7_SETIT
MRDCRHQLALHRARRISLRCQSSAQSSAPSPAFVCSQSEEDNGHEGIRHTWACLRPCRPKHRHARGMQGEHRQLDPRDPTTATRNSSLAA